jgi:hypothetical protein
MLRTVYVIIGFALFFTGQLILFSTDVTASGGDVELQAYYIIKVIALLLLISGAVLVFGPFGRKHK